MKKLSETIQSKRRLVISMTGVLTTGFSIGVLKAAGMGTDPFNVLLSGLTSLFSVNYTVIFVILNATMLLIAFLVNRGWIGLATFLILAFTGGIAQFTSGLLGAFVASLDIRIVIPLVIAGLLLQCFGVALCIVSDLGVGPYDAVYLILSERLHISIRTCRILMDFSCAVIGLLLGGVAGFVTVFAVVSMGPAINMLVKILARLPLIKHAGDFALQKDSNA
jgi:uncharacterized membrane protein YczE